MLGRLFFVFLGLVLTTIARADMRSADSLELTVANADFVARGHITKVVSPAPLTALGYFEFQVTEQFKGPRTDKVTIDFDNWGNSALAQTLLKGGTEAMIFRIDPAQLTPRSRDDRYRTELAWRALTILPLLPAPETDPTRKHRSQVVTMDGGVLSTGPQLIAAVREAAKFPSTQPVRWVEVLPPRNSPAYRELSVGSNIRIQEPIQVPVDSRLESLGHTWLSKGELSLAISTLKLFPTPQNTEIFRKMLRDPTLMTEPAGRLSHVYYTTRLHAAEVLRSWGQPVDLAAGILPDDLYQPLHGPLVATALAGLILLAWFVRRAARRVIRGLPVLALLLMSALAALWITSRTTVPELYWNGDTTQVWLSPFRGWVQLTWMTDCPSRLTTSRDYLTSRAMLARPRFVAQQVDPPRGLLCAMLPTDSLIPLWWTMPTNVSRKYYVANNGLLLGTQQESFSAPRSPGTVTAQFHRLQIHMSVFMLFVTIPLLTAICRWRNRRRRRNGNLCLQCGYDLRGSSGRCPECGILVAQH